MFCCDLQDKFRPSIRHFPAILSNANRMLQSAKLLDIPLVVTEQHPKGIYSYDTLWNALHLELTLKNSVDS